jgi:hypothetical protein
MDLTTFGATLPDLLAVTGLFGTPIIGPLIKVQIAMMAAQRNSMSHLVKGPVDR